MMDNVNILVRLLEVTITYVKEKYDGRNEMFAVPR